ncbi:MAG TPA: hypothetical protein VMU05_22020 [Dongiaceae bacterium]|nr:hypothetical protein [Dongiaceae bacterium]
MNHYEFIPREMLVSTTARSVYRTAAVASLTIFVTIPALRIAGPNPVLNVLLFLGVVGTALIFTGMEFFLFRFDDSRAWKQVLWFCLMLIVPLGAAMYCFLVYSRLDVLKQVCAAGN